MLAKFHNNFRLNILKLKYQNVGQIHNTFILNILKLKYQNVGQIHMNFILNILGEEPVLKELEMDVIYELFGF